MNEKFKSIGKHGGRNEQYIPLEYFIEADICLHCQYKKCNGDCDYRKEEFKKRTGKDKKTRRKGI